MAKIAYPLQQVLEIKMRRVENAEKVVKEKRELLKKEEEKLKEREEARDKVLHHYEDKMLQLREEMDNATTTDKILQARAYIKVVKEQLKVEEKKVADQKKQVEVAQKNLELALEDLKLKRLEVDKLETHRDSWKKEIRKEIEIEEGREQDELGNIIHTLHHRPKPREHYK